MSLERDSAALSFKLSGENPGLLLVCNVLITTDRYCKNEVLNILHLVAQTFLASEKEL